MNYVEAVYEKYRSLSVQSCCRMYRYDGDFLIVMNDNLEIFYLTETAREMMACITDKIKIDDLYQKIITEYDVDPLTLKSDLLDFIKEMQWKKVVSLNKS